MSYLSYNKIFSIISRDTNTENLRLNLLSFCENYFNSALSRIFKLQKPTIHNNSEPVREILPEVCKINLIHFSESMASFLVASEEISCHEMLQEIKKFDLVRRRNC